MTDHPEWTRLYEQIAHEDDPAARAELIEQLHTAYLAAPHAATPGGLPYPDPTDPVAQGADAIRALAEALPPKLIRQNNSQSGVTYTTNSVGEFRITFPTPFGNAFPLVQAWHLTNPLYQVNFVNTGGTYGVDAASFVVRVVRLTDGTALASTAVAIRYIAIGQQA